MPRDLLGSSFCIPGMLVSFRVSDRGGRGYFLKKQRDGYSPHFPQPHRKKHQLKAFAWQGLLFGNSVSPPPRWPSEWCLGHQLGNTYSPSLALGTQAHRDSCGFSLVRCCGHPGRPGTGLAPQQAPGGGPHGSRGPVLECPHFMKRTSHVFTSRAICYSAILLFLHVSEH